MHLGNFECGGWSLGGGKLGAGFHGCQYQFQVLKVVSCDDGLDIGMLGQVDGSALMVMFDFDAEDPVELA